MRKVIIDIERLKGALWGKQPMVADKLGIHHNTLSRKINREGGLRLSELNIIAEALGRDTMEFIREVEIDNEAYIGRRR